MKLKKNIKKAVAKLIRPIATRVGYISTETIVKANNKNTLIATTISNLKQIGFQPNHIVDVGANHGTWTREFVKHFPNAYYTLVEPQNWLKKSFEDLLLYKKFQYFPVGAGEKTGSFKFTIHKRDDSCSFKYTEEEAKALGYEQVEIKVETLNDLLKFQSNFPPPDLIKIDAEGLDIEVLKGASSFFGKTEVFLVEVGVGNKSIDNNVLSMITFMNNNGYRLFDITDLNRPYTPKVLWLMELVFVKKNGIIDIFKVN